MGTQAHEREFITCSRMERSMLKIAIDPKVLAKFRELLAEEDNENAVFRIRETKVGGGCKSRVELRVSPDEREDPTEEQEILVEGLPFVVSNEVIDSYGLEYSIFADDHDMPAVRSPLQPAQTECPIARAKAEAEARAKAKKGE